MEKKSILGKQTNEQDSLIEFLRRFEKRHFRLSRGEAHGEAWHPGSFGVAMRGFASLSTAMAMMMLSGCGSTKQQAKNQDFFTSGDRDADQRASQRMAQSEQLSGNGEGAGEKGVKKAQVVQTSTALSGTNATDKVAPAQAEGKLALFDRLGGEDGLNKIVADFLPRAMQDPRVNWDRDNVTKGGFSIHHNESVTWKGGTNNVVMLQKHLVEFLALATGGPAHYDGKQMRPAHENMHISNSEFDATIGDLKVTLDRLQVPNKEQKELLAIVESTRPEIVTEH